MSALRIVGLVGILSFAAFSPASAAVQGPDVSIVSPGDGTTRHATNPTIHVSYGAGGSCFVGDPLCWPLASYLVELNGNEITSSFTFGDLDGFNGTGNYGANNFSNGSNTVHFQACSGYGCSDAYATVTISVDSTFTVAGAAHPSVQPTSTCQGVPFAPGAAFGCDGWYYTHAIPGYITLGTARSSGLIYSSRVAAGRALAPVDISMVWDKAASTVEGWWIFGGVSGSHVYWDGRGWDGSSGSVQSRLVVDVPPDSLPMIGRKVVNVGVRVTTVGSGTVDSTAKDTLSLYFLHDSTTTPIARGWGIAGTSRIYPSQGPQLTSFNSTWSVLVTSSDGGAAYFRRDSTPSTTTYYTRPDGVLAALTSASDGSWFKLLGIDGSTSYFSWSSSLGYARLDSTVDNTYVTRVLYRSGSGNPQDIIDPKGDSTYFGYSASGLGGLDSICAPKGAHQQCTTISYTTSNSETVVDHITDPDGVQTAFKYRTSSFVHPMLDSVTPRARGTYAVVYYDTLPRPSAVVLPGGDTLHYLAPQLAGFAVTGGSSGSPATAAPSDSAWGIVTQPVGEASKFAVDRYGKTVVSRDAAGNLRQLNENADGQPAELSVALSEKHVWNYNAVGALTSEGNLASQITTTYTYDGACASATGYPCRVNIQVFNLEPYIPDTVQTFYDGSGTLVDSVYHANHGTAHFTREGSGFNRVTQQADFQGHTTSFAYDGTTGNVSRVVSDTATPCAGCGARRDTTRSKFDALGRDSVLQHGDTGLRVITEYDVMGRAIKQRAIDFSVPDTIITQTLYDDANRTVTVRDGLSHDIVYRWNLRGLVTSRIDPASHHDSITYDADDRVSTWRNRRDSLVSYTYDAAGRLSTKTLNGHTWTYGYESALGLGVLNYVSNPEATVSRSFDWQGRLTEESSVINGHTFNVSYRYADTSSVVTLLTDPWSGSYTFDYSAASRTRTITNPFSQSFTLTSDENGLLARVGFPVHSDTMTYSPLHQPLTAGLSGEISYARDTLFRLDSLSYPSSFVQAFTHDGYGRLAGETMSSAGPASESFGYDRAGNRIGTGYHYNSPDAGPNAVTQRPAIAGDLLSPGDSLRYDYDGNPIWWQNTGTGAHDELLWDAENRLIEIRRYDGGNNLTNDITYGYDGLGRRVRMSPSVPYSGLGTKLFVWDGWNLLAMTDSAGNAIHRYTYDPANVDYTLSYRAGSSTRYLHHDGQGNIYKVEDADGSLLSDYRYRAWGDRYEVSGVGDISSPLTYKGAQQDYETGLVYMRNRYYSPRLERFLNQDPIGIRGGLNAYTFGNDAPVTNADPSGLCVEDLCILEAAAAWTALEWGVSWLEGKPMTPEEIASSFSMNAATGFLAEALPFWAALARMNGGDQTLLRAALYLPEAADAGAGIKLAARTIVAIGPSGGGGSTLGTTRGSLDPYSIGSNMGGVYVGQDLSGLGSGVYWSADCIDTASASGQGWSITASWNHCNQTGIVTGINATGITVQLPLGGRITL